MAVEVAPDIFRMEVPLPGNPLRSVNSYIIRGNDDGNMMVDTAMNRPECREVLERELSDLDVDMTRTDVFVTHMHADHLGLAPYLTGGRGTVFLGKEDAAFIDESDYWMRMYAYGVMNGFPRLDPMEAIRKHPGYRYGPLGEMNLRALAGGERFTVGRYEFRTVHTPGHTEGHMMLYEKEEGILFSGDHILFDITPNISLFEENKDPLSEYISSLKMTRELRVENTFPGHRTPMKDPGPRIEELISHHLQRAEEAFDILRDSGPMTAMDVASRMTWDMRGSFEEFPLMQKWFALGEAIAHLRFLETNNKVDVKERGGILRYSPI